MKIDDYRKKVFLKLYKKQVDFLDNKKQVGNFVGYQKYFNKILEFLKPEFLEASDYLKSDNKILQEDDKLFDNVYVMWWQGMQNAPLLIKNNINKMQTIFGENRVHIITQDNWKEFCSISSVIIQKFYDGKISIAALSDIIRFNILKKYGGLWVDSTVILSENCKDLLLKYENKDFFSISNRDQDYHYISKSRWAIWLIGGKAGYPLFNFIDAFYNLYFEKHNFLIDYYTTDDIIAYFYKTNRKFKEDVYVNSNDWHPYLLSDNMNELYDKRVIENVKAYPLYGVQKFTYKYDKKLASDSKTLLYAIINNHF